MKKIMQICHVVISLTFWPTMALILMLGAVDLLQGIFMLQLKAWAAGLHLLMWVMALVAAYELLCFAQGEMENRILGANGRAGMEVAQERKRMLSAVSMAVTTLGLVYYTPLIPVTVKGLDRALPKMAAIAAVITAVAVGIWFFTELRARMAGGRI